MSAKLNLYQKIQAVSKSVKVLSKDMIVGQGQYSYKAVSDNSVILAINKAEQEHGLISIPFNQEIESSEVLKTIDKHGKEVLKYHENIKMTTRIVDLEDPSNYLDVVSFGKGLDSSDKGFGKASTYARKYALLNAYKIATGEDPDKDKSNEDSTPNTPSEKRVEVSNYLNKNVNTLQQILKHFSVGELNDLTDSQVDTIYKTYKQKKLI
jgi:hypothetical protein